MQLPQVPVIRALKTVLIIATLAAVASSAAATDAPATQPIKQAAAEKALSDAQAARDALRAASDFDVIWNLPEQWSKSLSPEARKELIILLVMSVRSDKELAVVNYADMVVTSRVHSGKMAGSIPGLWLRQDVFILGGRCAWAIEQLLHCELPEFSEGLKEPELSYRSELSYRAVIRAMQLPEQLSK
jgi:hypothetical protein